MIVKAISVDPSRKTKIIARRYVHYETVLIFQELIDSLIKQGLIIKAIVVDGKRGALNAYPHIPTQMCQFHQIQIINRYLSTRPKLEAGKQLRQIALQLTKIDKKQFTKLLDLWILKWGDFLKERTFTPITTPTTPITLSAARIKTKVRRWHYTHKNLRSAYSSLRRHLPHLFIYQQKDLLEYQVPNTTNSLEGLFSHLDDTLRVHRGILQKKKIKLIESWLWDK